MELVETGYRCYSLADATQAVRGERPWILIGMTLLLWATLCLVVFGLFWYAPSIEIFEVLSIAAIMACGFAIVNILLIFLWGRQLTVEIDMDRRQVRRIWSLLSVPIRTVAFDVHNEDEIVLFAMANEGHGGSHSFYLVRGNVYRYIAAFSTDSPGVDIDLLDIFDQVGLILTISNRGYAAHSERLAAMIAWLKSW